MVIPAILWSILILIFRFYQGQISNRDASIQSFLMILFGPVGGVYWYLYTAIGLYLFALILSGWLTNTSRRMIERCLILWRVTLFLPYLNGFLSGVFHINAYAPSFALCGFAGYMVLDYYLSHFDFHFKSYFVQYPWYFLFFIGVTIGIIGIPPIVYFIKRIFDYEFPLQYDLYLVLQAMLMSTIIFLIVKYRYDHISAIHRFCAYLAPVTSGIYLVHFVVPHDYV